jgi:hypothetical protein
VSVSGWWGQQRQGFMEHHQTANGWNGTINGPMVNGDARKPRLSSDLNQGGKALKGELQCGVRREFILTVDVPQYVCFGAATAHNLRFRCCYPQASRAPTPTQRSYWRACIPVRSLTCKTVRATLPQLQLGCIY